MKQNALLEVKNLHVSAEDETEILHGVNLTLGLPIIRTSPDHGTAFNIAGMGKADAGPTIAAIAMAARMAAARDSACAPAQ